MLAITFNMGYNEITMCETIATGAPETCPDCLTKVKLGVYMSAAGYYIGTYCECGPYSRESLLYFLTKEDAQEVFNNDNWTRR
jgi:hypothetical protein